MATSSTPDLDTAPVTLDPPQSETQDVVVSPYRISRLGAAALYCSVVAVTLSALFAIRLYLGVHSHGIVGTSTGQWVATLIGIPFALAGLALAAGARSAIARSEGTLLSPGLAIGSGIVALVALGVYAAAVPVLLLTTV